MAQEKRSTSLRRKHRSHFQRSKPACYLCGESIDYTLQSPDPRSFVVDHIVPIARGGADVLSNKAAAHRECNATKGAKQHDHSVRRSGALG